MQHSKQVILVGAVGAAAVLIGTSRPAAAPETGWGTVKGRIVWVDKTVPEREVEIVDKDKRHCLEKGTIRQEKWVVHKDNRGVRWVFVWLGPDPPNAKARLPVHPSLREVRPKSIEMDQPCCVFIPHALAVRQGQEVVVKNSSPVSHDVRWAGDPLRNPGNDVLVAPRGSHTIK